MNNKKYNRRMFLKLMLLGSSSNLLAKEEYSESFLNLFGDFLEKRRTKFRVERTELSIMRMESSNNYVASKTPSVEQQIKEQIAAKPIQIKEQIAAKPIESTTIVASNDLVEKSLSFYLPNRSVRREVVYKRGDQYVNSDLVSEVFKDHHDGSVRDIDTNLLDLLYEMQAKNSGKRIELLSGYRSARTNKNLRRHNSGVAKHSYHIRGKAADIRFRGVSQARVSKMARKMKMGGVGSYRRSKFTHVDVGPVRTWNG